jgi:pyruvate formate lyase activating enzyme
MAYPIKGFNPHTFIDWEGMLSSVIYLPGCNFRCPFCHSSVLVKDPDSLKTVPFEHIERYVETKDGWLDAMVIQGGEPTLYEQLPELLRDIKRLGLKIKVDTNGSRPEMLDRVIGQKLVDYIAMDIKAPLEAGKYSQATLIPADIGMIKESIALLLKSNIEYEFRTTVVPTIIGQKDIIEIAKSIGNAKKYILQQFDPKDTMDESLSEVKPYDPQTLEQWAGLAREFVKTCSVRGI